MQVHIHAKSDARIECQDLDGEIVTHDLTFDIDPGWHKITIPLPRKELIKIEVDGEDIRYYINAGHNTEKGYVLWLNGDLEQYYTRTSESLAQDDLLRFKNMPTKYMHTDRKITSLNSSHAI